MSPMTELFYLWSGRVMRVLRLCQSQEITTSTYLKNVRNRVAQRNHQVPKEKKRRIVVEFNKW